MTNHTQNTADRVASLTGSDTKVKDPEFYPVGLNSEVCIDADGVMTIKVDLKQRFGPSASGKSTAVAKTAGAIDLGVQGAKLNLNVFVPIPKHLQEPKVEVHRL